MSSLFRRPPAPSGGSVGIAAAMGIMNVATYGYTILAARMLGPRSYGAFAAVMGLLLVLSVLQLGLQATGARRIASTPDHVGEIERAVLRVTYRAATGLAVLCLLFSPLIDAGLHLGSVGTAALVALAAWPMTLMGGQAGVLQGERRWYALAMVYLSVGVSRVFIGTIVLIWKPTESLAIFAVAVAFFAPVVVGWIALRRSAVHRDYDATGGHDVRSVWWESVRNSHALMAFLALSNADVIVARSVLDPHDAGLYAGGLILVKAVLFLPQFVVVVAFPSMSSAHERRDALRKGLTLVSALGVLSVAASWALSEVALIFIGGEQYADIQNRLWVFALLGTMLSLIQLLVYSVVAHQSHRTVYLIWASLVVLLVGATQVSGVTQLVVLVSAVDGTLLALLLGFNAWRARQADQVAVTP